jgi:peroxiredoxin Q/BCP
LDAHRRKETPLKIERGGGMLEAGSKAPEFSLLDDHGRTVSLSDFAGKNTVVLFFFPKADTPG